MSDPQRFCEGGGGALEKQVVDSARGQGPSPRLRRQVEVALGLAAGLPAATVATNALGASKAAQAGVAAGLAKWVGVVSITGLAAAGATVYVSARAGAGASSLPVPNGTVARTSASAPRPPTSAPRSPIAASPAPSTQEAAPPPPATTAAPATTPRSGPAAAPTVPPAPVATVLPSKSAPTLSDELRVLDEARAAMETGDSERALALLDRHDREFASPALAPEAMALRVEVYARRGDREATARLAARFLERFGDRPEAQRVRSLVDAPALEAKP
jgi:hypothetical protein